MATATRKNVVILDRKEALRRAGNLSKSTERLLYMNDPTFPKKVYLSTRRVGYYEDEWSAWLASRRAVAVKRAHNQEDPECDTCTAPPSV